MKLMVDSIEKKKKQEKKSALSSSSSYKSKSDFCQNSDDSSFSISLDSSAKSYLYNEQECTQGYFIIVNFVNKKTKVHYIGNVIQMIILSLKYEVKFRHHQRTVFVYVDFTKNSVKIYKSA